MRTGAPLLLPLFRSANQERLLSYVFLVKGQKTIQDLSNDLDIPYTTVHREVGRLLDAGLIREMRMGNYRFIEPNQVSPYYEPLHQLLKISAWPVTLLKQALGSVKGVEKVFIFGSWAHRFFGQRGSVPEDIDVLVIGEPDLRKVYAGCATVEKQLRLPVNPTIMNLKEWQADTPFLKNVRKGGVVNVIGLSDSDMSL